jgi:hypothetical protein
MRILNATAFTITLFIFAQIANAQMNNKPFSFNGSPGGNVGISMGGRQAVLNKEFFDETPRNMIRSRDGRLLDVTVGPGHSAIVSYESGEFIPSFRGASDFRMNDGAAAGVFNAYFSPSHGGTGIPSFSSGSVSSTAISTWTAQIVGNGIPYSPGNTVDTWTTMVYSSY